MRFYKVSLYSTILTLLKKVNNNEKHLLDKV